ncbi:MAG: hypothetical protein JWN72_576 [Thermoleophilia bacterium]|nr:hypothetical protein [Thermoleophilia bacterium]
MSTTSTKTTTTTSTARVETQLEGAPTNVRIDVPAMVVAKLLFVVLAFALGVLILRELAGFLIQLAIALFLAIAADPIVRKLERAGIGRGRAIAIVMVTAFVAIGGALSVFVPPLVTQGDRLISNAPGIVRDARDSKLIDRLDRRFDIVDKATEEAGKLPKVVGKEVGSVVGAVVAGIFGAISILFLTLFLLAGGGQAARGTVRVFPRLAERRWWAIIQGAYTGISAYVGGAIIIALLGGASVALMAFILGLPYALPLGLWMMLLEIIPMIGATIGAVPAIIVAFVVGGPVKGIIMIAFIIVYQQIENIVIQPRVQGRAAALSPLVVFMSVLIGSQLLGVLGALFAVPVAGVVQIFMRQVIEQRGTEDMHLPALISGEPVSEGEIAADGPTDVSPADGDLDADGSDDAPGDRSGRDFATE